jgi:hypothetical protein
MSDAPAPIETAMKGLLLVKVRPLVKGALRAFVSFSYGQIIVHDAPLLESNGKVWVSLPGKPRFDRDGAPLLDSRGKALYDPICSWGSRDGADKIQGALIEVIRETYPAVLAAAE